MFQCKRCGAKFPKNKKGEYHAHARWHCPMRGAVAAGEPPTSAPASVIHTTPPPSGRMDIGLDEFCDPVTLVESLSEQDIANNIVRLKQQLRALEALLTVAQAKRAPVTS